MWLLNGSSSNGRQQQSGSGAVNAECNSAHCLRQGNPLPHHVQWGHHCVNSKAPSTACAIPAHHCCSCCLLCCPACVQQPGANNWNVCSPSAAGGGLVPPDDWEIDISQLHIDSKVSADGVCDSPYAGTCLASHLSSILLDSGCSSSCQQRVTCQQQLLGGGRHAVACSNPSPARLAVVFRYCAVGVACEHPAPAMQLRAESLFVPFVLRAKLPCRWQPAASATCTAATTAGRRWL